MTLQSVSIPEWGLTCQQVGVFLFYFNTTANYGMTLCDLDKENAFSLIQAKLLRKKINKNVGLLFPTSLFMCPPTLTHAEDR